MASKPQELREHIKVLTDFERDYRSYVTTQMRQDMGEAGPLTPDQLPTLRAQLVRRVSRAGRAFDASGVQMAITPPPMFGGPVLTSLASQAFAHETPTFGSGHDGFEAARMVLDGLGTAVGALEDKLEQEQARAQKRQPPARALQGAQHHLPTLWGRIRALPDWFASAADLITVVGFVAGLVTKLAGLW